MILNAAADTRAGAARRNALKALSVSSLIVPSADTNAMHASTVSPRLAAKGSKCFNACVQIDQ